MENAKQDSTANTDRTDKNPLTIDEKSSTSVQSPQTDKVKPEYAKSVPHGELEHNNWSENKVDQDSQGTTSLEFKTSSTLNEVDELELKIVSFKQELRVKEKQSLSYLRMSIVLLIISLAIGIWASQTISYLLWALLVLFIILTSLMFIAVLGSRINEEKVNSEIETLEARKRILSRFNIDSPGKKETATSSYFDKLVRINIENLSEYYSLIKVHTSNSYRVSVTSGVLGFILIIIGLVIGFVNISVADYLAYVVTGAGVLIEFVSGIFFYLYNRTIRELKGYHESLLVVQNILLSFKIIEEITDEREKATMLGKMLEFLMTSQIGKTPIQNMPKDSGS